MKTIIKLSLLLALLLPATAKAYDFEVDGIYYNINGNEATVTYQYQYENNYNSYSGDVTIPETVTYDGTTYSVTSIGAAAFGSCTRLTSVTIPNSVTSIGEAAFSGCSGLTSINIPNSVTSIGSFAFWNCYGLTSVTIPDSVTSIGDHAFEGCSGLTSVTIPDSVTSIGTYAFWYCYGLTSVTIPDSVTSIGAYAFEGCYGLTSVTIPNSVTSIGDQAFYRCSGLTSVTIGNSVTSIYTQAFGECSGLKNLTWNAIKCTSIGNMTTSNLENVIIGNEVESLPAYFAYNSKITSIDIPNSVTSIGQRAFSFCSELTSVTIPNSVTSIPYEAFRECTGLTSVTIPDSVTSIGDYAFYKCTGLTDVYCYISDPSIVTTGSFMFYLSSKDYSARTLHVPAGTLEAYQADARWSQYFGNIVEMEPEVILASSIELNVTTAGLNEGATLQLTATVLPEDAADKSVTWTSSDESVATVDDNGLVTMQGDGTATITAMTTDGSDLSTTCTVTLLPVGIKGDINGDEKISIGDVTTLITYLLTGSW